MSSSIQYSYVYVCVCVCTISNQMCLPKVEYKNMANMWLEISMRSKLCNHLCMLREYIIAEMENGRERKAKRERERPSGIDSVSEYT